MTEEFQLAFAVLAVFVIYVAAKVLLNMRRSDQEWRRVDKSELKEWKDDD